MEFSAKQIAQMLQGTVVGDENAVVSKLCKIEEGERGGLSFLANSKYNQYIYDTEASIVIVNEDFEPEQTVKATMIKVKDAYSCFAQLLEVYNAYRLNKTGTWRECLRWRICRCEQWKQGRQGFEDISSRLHRR